MKVDEALSRLIIEHITTGVLMFDDELNILNINAAAEDLLLMSNRQVAGQQLDTVMPLANDFKDSLRRSRETGASIAQWALNLPLANQKIVVVDCVITPFRVEDDKDYLIVEMMNTYFHKRITKEENLIALSNTSEQLGRALAHEIKNPLGGLRGAAQLLNAELQNDEHKEYTGIIIKEADRLRNLVDKMLAPEKQLEFSTGNIHEILDYVCNILKAETDRRFNIVTDYDPSLPELWADRESLVQVFLNIIRNAIQSIHEGGEVLLRTRAERKVTIAQVLHKLCIRVDVIDDGPGIPTNLVDKIFYPMITSRAEGTGLGLPIAQSLIQKHGGIIEYNRIEQRTVFTTLIPWEDHDD